MQPLLLLSALSWTCIVSVGSYPALEALFETKDDRETHDEERNTATSGPEVALRLISVGDAWKVRSEVRL